MGRLGAYCTGDLEHIAQKVNDYAFMAESNREKLKMEVMNLKSPVRLPVMINGKSHPSNQVVILHLLDQTTQVEIS
jgi:hypothetical protein